MDLQSLQMDKSYFTKIIQNISYNKQIVNYYDQLFAEVPDKTIFNKKERLEECNSFYVLDKYEKQKIKDFQKTNLCKDKFCNNCKKVKQASRMAKFLPEIEKHKTEGLSQLVLTVPNVSAEELKPAIEILFKSFTRLSEYLKGKKKIKGLDFTNWGYLGAIRSLEVTYSEHDYHPHLHVLLCMTGDIGEKNIENKYSIDYLQGRQKRFFSEKEILIQKIWYLLVNRIKVTKKSIDLLDTGYSCSLDPFQENDFIELFKYMTKVKKDNDDLMTYTNFKTLYYSLHSVRQIQGYGCFFGIVDDDSIIDEVKEEYLKIVESLQKEENPLRVVESPEDLKNNTYYLIISRKRLFEYMRKLVD